MTCGFTNRLHPGMLHFLTDEHRASLLKLFQTNTEAGRQIRQIFGSSQQVASRKVSYPPVFARSSSQENLPKPLCKRKVTIAYPKLAPKATEQTIEHTRPGRRPVSVIKETHIREDVHSNLTATKDLSHEKAKLQDTFQFSSSNPLHDIPHTPSRSLVDMDLFNRLV
jgi:hypothetical protein